MSPARLAQIEKKIEGRLRLNGEDATFFLTEAPLLWLGQLAQGQRFLRHPAKEVSFVVDSNPNYTNICDTGCHFCAFFRRPQDADSYSLTVEEVMAKIDRVVRQGATTILLQGGHNRALPFPYYVELVKETRRRFPHVTPHFFTASEIQTMADVSGLRIEDVLRNLWDAGQRTLPGGGAEILSERVRKEISFKKGGPEAWLRVHRAAHEIGFLSTATMMYGHVEEAADLVEHWDRLRRLQDESLDLTSKGRFTAFIPWSFKPDNTVLERKFPRRMGPVPYLRILAASRLFLDNFEHVQASWFSEGKKTGQAALHFGADDFGGTLYDENVHAEAGFVNVTTLEEMIRLIHEAGFDAVQRTTSYELVKRFSRGAFAHEPQPRDFEMSYRKNRSAAAGQSSPIDFVPM